MRCASGVTLVLLVVVAGCGQGGKTGQSPPSRAIKPQESAGLALAGAWQLYSQAKPDPDAMPEDRPVPPEPSAEILELKADGTFRKLRWWTGDERDADAGSEGKWLLKGNELVLQPEVVGTHTREQFEQGLREELRQKGNTLSEKELKLLFDDLYSDTRLTLDASTQRLLLQPKGDSSLDVIFKHHDWFYIRAR